MISYTSFNEYALYLLLFLSGFAGLGYEIVWTRMLSSTLDHEIVAVLAVVGAFFSGLALGAWALDRVVSCSSVPGRWYAGLEAVVGLWSLLLAGVFPLTNQMALNLMGIEPAAWRHWAVAFLYPFFLLLPATFAMGGTLPAMERLFSRLRRDGQTVGGLYAANTLGAVGGMLLNAFYIVPELGFGDTQHVLAVVIFFAQRAC